MTWRACPREARRWAGDYVAPTSLNEGRGEVVLVLVVVLSFMVVAMRWYDFWSKYAGCRSSPNAERRLDPGAKLIYTI